MTLSTLLPCMTPVITAPTTVEPAHVSEQTTVSDAIAHRIPAGWYRDRESPGRRRWWNGERWTDFYSAPLVAPLAQPVQAIPSPRHSAATGPSPLPGAPVAAAQSSSTYPPVPTLVIVVLVALVGANTVLLALLALTR